jgi:hypothetical protein
MNANYLSGQSNVALTGASLLGVDGTSSFSWVVPSALANQPLKLVVDNTEDPDGQGDGSTNLRVTIRVQLVPVIQAQFVAENTTVAMNTLVGFDASSTPNNLGQISQYTWDFDSTIDGNGDGDFINDVDAIGLTSEAQWTSPGERIVTLTVLGQSSFDRQEQTITVNDIINPVPRITGTTASSPSATPVSGGWRIAYANTLVLTCNSSSDDDSISSCSWSLDGTPYNQQTTVSFNWSTIGEHVVGLTVFDGSGNSASTQVDVRVVDGSIPVIDDFFVSQFKNSLEEGQIHTYSINANDVYDSASNLRYHWDINPSKDTDQNGNPTDDPDYIGPNVDLLFDTAGTKQVVVTVFDASNNTDTRTFTIVVEESVESSTNFGLIAVVLFIFVVTLSISFIGYRRWQSSIAVGLLTGRGLSDSEAKAHMTMVRQSQKLPLFAKAIQLAGLDVGEVVTQDQQEQARKEAELQSIYGNGEVEEIPQAQFAPKREISQASSQAAAEAAALFFDDAPPAPAPVITQDPDDALLQELGSMNEKPSQTPQSGGIQLPENLAPTVENPPPTPEVVEEEKSSNLLKGSCNSCSLKFQVPMPDGVNEAIVVCPSCSEEQLFQR